MKQPKLNGLAFVSHYAEIGFQVETRHRFSQDGDRVVHTWAETVNGDPSEEIVDAYRLVDFDPKRNWVRLRPENPDDEDRYLKIDEKLFVPVMWDDSLKKIINVPEQALTDPEVQRRLAAFGEKGVRILFPEYRLPELVFPLNWENTYNQTYERGKGLFRSDAENWYRARSGTEKAGIEWFMQARVFGWEEKGHFLTATFLGLPPEYKISARGEQLVTHPDVTIFWTVPYKRHPEIEADMEKIKW